MDALHMAAASGKPEMLRLALQSAANINAVSSPNGFTALHMAVTGSTDDDGRVEIIKMLCKNGANMEIHTLDKGLTPLQLAAIRNKPNCASALIECGADVHAVENAKATALHGACYFGYAEVVRVLLAGGANPGMKDGQGITPMALAISSGNTDIQRMLTLAIDDPGKYGAKS